MMYSLTALHGRLHVAKLHTAVQQSCCGLWCHTTGVRSSLRLAAVSSSREKQDKHTDHTAVLLERPASTSRSHLPGVHCRVHVFQFKVTTDTFRIDHEQRHLSTRSTASRSPIVFVNCVHTILLTGCFLFASSALDSSAADQHVNRHFRRGAEAAARQPQRTHQQGAFIHAQARSTTWQHG